MDTGAEKGCNRENMAAGSSSEPETFQKTADNDDDKNKPKNVPSRLWEKFKALEKRTDETTRRTTEKRIKHLQKTALENVSSALSAEDREFIKLPEAESSEQQNSDLDKASASASVAAPSRKRRIDIDQVSGETPVETREKIKKGSSSSSQADGLTDQDKEWRRVRGLIGINDHLAGVSQGSLGPKTVLETKIEAAIADGDLKTAEELSDHMAQREFGEKVTMAIDAKNFLEHKQKEEEVAKAKKKKKLHWGFEAKHRWETKSNM